MPKPYPEEFRDDVVKVALDRDADVTLEQIAESFGIQAKRRVTLLEQENEILRRASAYLSQANLRRD